MRNQRLAHPLRVGLRSVRGQFALAPAALALLLVVAACAEPPAPAPAGSALADFASGVDASFGVETFAVSAPTLKLLSPTGLTSPSVPLGGSISVDFAFQVSNFTMGKVRCYRDGTFVGAATVSPYKFLGITRGLHTLSCVLANDANVELTDTTARAGVQVLAISPCSSGADCQDNNACSDGDYCSAGKCLYTVMVACCVSKDDCPVGASCVNPNTMQSKCSYCAVNTDCDDGDSCTTDTCDLGGFNGMCKNVKADPNCCTKASDPCDDGKPCTTDSCDVAAGKCKHVLPPGVCCAPSDCADDDICTSDDCVDGACRHSPDSLKPDCCNATTNTACNDDNVCTIDACNIQAAGYIKCSHTFDVSKPNCCNMPQFGCNDDQPCTQDECINFQCLHTEISSCCTSQPECDDNNICTSDYCDVAAKICSHSLLPGCCSDSTECSDGKACTYDNCNTSLHTCVHAKADQTCCDSAAECSDGLYCTVDVCINYACIFGLDSLKPGCCDTNANCNDGNICTIDSCDPNTHKCVFISNGDTNCCNTADDCDDKDCTTIDLCDSNSQCAHKAAPEKCKVDLDCQDNKPCTVDTCQVIDGCGTCYHTPTAGCCSLDADCNDNKPCTTDLCAQNVCTHDPTSGCCIDDTDALTKCDDQNGCTIDYCLNNQCRHTSPKNGCCASGVDCDDGDSCTSDTCGSITNGVGTCSHTLAGGCVCSEAGALAGAECNDNNPCTEDACPNNTLCTHSMIAGCCLDKFDCSDGLPCTFDACVLNECLNYTTDGSGATLCCAVDADCAHLNAECATGKCVTQDNGFKQCEPVEKSPCTLPLSYCQDFSSSSSLTAMGWNPADVVGAASGNWATGTAGPLGPDQYAQLKWSPSSDGFETCLASPVFQAAGASTITLQYDREYVPNIDDLTVRIRGSLNGAATNWADSTLIESVSPPMGPLGPETIHLTMPPALSNSNGLRLAFCVAGSSTYDLTRFAIDNVCVVKGGPPQILNCPPNQIVQTGTTLTLPLKVLDPDATDIISFTIVKGPSFVKVSSALYYWLDSTWNSSLTIKPLALSDTGDHEITVKVSDGYLYKLCTFHVTVTYEGGVLIWKPTEVPTDHATAIKNSLAKLSKFGQIVESLALYPTLAKFDSVFITLGVYPKNHVLVESEVAAIKLYLSQGGNVYMEGGDTWMYDQQTTLQPYFKAKGIVDSAPNGVTGPLDGFAAYTDPLQTPAKQYHWNFSQEVAYDTLNDQIEGQTSVPRTRNILRNSGTETFWVQVAHDDAQSNYRTIASAIPFAGVTPALDAPDDMMKQIVKFFDNGFGVCTANAECDDGNACTTDTCADGECAHDNTCLCGAQNSIACGDTFTKIVTNSGAATQVATTYACDPLNEYLGKEIAYSYQALASAPVTVNIANVSNANARIFVLKATSKGCDPGGCVAFGTTSVTFPAGMGSTYYFVVDTPSATESTQYDLNVTCGSGENCSDDIDNNGNGAIDCQDHDSCCGDANCQTETCDGQDNNCNGLVDEGCDDDGDLHCDGAMTVVGTPAVCGSGGGDCRDDDGTVNPGATEICNNGKDDNCNGVQDEEDADGCLHYFTDVDKDTYGTGDWRCLCQPSGDYTALLNGDCNDADLNVNPGTKETCATVVDDNCDGTANDIGATECKNFYTDQDSDTFGTNPFQCVCLAEGMINTLKSGDCADLNAGINPGIVEVYDNIDNNCDGQTDEGCDDDNDEYCDITMQFAAGGSTACAKGAGDTDDGDPAINPEGIEICDDKDNNSNGGTDEGCDDDLDGYCDFAMITINTPKVCLHGGGTGIATGGDCNDTNPAVNAGVNEDCATAYDDNCSGGTNDIGAEGCTPFFYDADDDNWGTSASHCTCIVEGWYNAPNPGDCRDNDLAINPAAIDICDNLDNDCNGLTDDGCDDDLDGYCDVNLQYIGSPGICPSGAGDCADNDAAVNPSKIEVCDNGKDDNCNQSQNDENATDCVTFYADSDADTYGHATTKKCLCVVTGVYSVTNNADCNDGEKTINPSATEICDGIDNNCNSATDEGCDQDGDGNCNAAMVFKAGGLGLCPKGGGDCNDTDATIYKTKLAEACDGGDDDCNGAIDNGCDEDHDRYCDGTKDVTQVDGIWPAVCTLGPGDCDDHNDDVNPGSLEICNNAYDDNCNGSSNDPDAIGCINEYFDGDVDGYGIVGGAPRCLCSPAGFYTSEVATDCNDDPSAAGATCYPGAKELCDVRDNDCNGVVDDPDATGCTLFYYDEDQDSYGISLQQCECGPKPPYSATVAGDCNDAAGGANSAIHPNAVEKCNDIDDNCDEQVDELCNKDADGYCDATRTTIGTPLVCALGGGDCNDNVKGVNPQATEACDNVDNNCSGTTDEGCDDDNDLYCDANLGIVGTPTICALGGNDCNDDPAAGGYGVNPGKKEVCGNTIDENCNGSSNDVDALGCKVFYADFDGDSFGKGGTAYRKLIVNELRRNSTGLSGAGANEYLELLVTDDVAVADLANLYFGDSTAGAAKDSAFRIDLSAAGFSTLKAGTVLLIGGAAAVTQDASYDPANGDWTLALQTTKADGSAGANIVTVTGAANFDAAEVVWVGATSTGTDTIDSLRWGAAAGALASAAKVTLTGVPSNGGGASLGNVSFTGDLTSVDVAASYVLNGSGTPGTPNGGANTAMVTFLRAMSLGGGASCQCVADPPGGTYKTTQSGDCNDANYLVYANATEICDDVDNDCDGVTDDGCNKDGDRYCDVGHTTIGTPAVCDKGGGDCNDIDAAINPGATEICGNAVDENCDESLILGGVSGCTVYYYDGDNDGWAITVNKCLCVPDGGYTVTDVAKIGDCDDTKNYVNPAKKEDCGTAYDDNCNGSQNDLDATGCEAYFTDVDQDGYGVGSSKCICVGEGVFVAKVAGDCKDDANDIAPLKTEICDGKDNNCVDGTDELCDQDGDHWCDAAKQTVGTPAACNLGGGDCNDSVAAIHKTAEELCDNIDNDCNGVTDEGCDNDKDGYCGSGVTVVLTAGAPPAVCVHSTNAGPGDDCNDAVSAINLGKAEICDDIDNNCSGQTDEGCDVDGDKYCTTAMSVIDKPAACIYGAGDCDDSNALINPGAIEACDNKDNNCAAGTDETCQDHDLDGYCNGVVAPGEACPKGGGDCDDTNAAVHPLATETCATAYDDDCNGLTNEDNATTCVGWFNDVDKDGYGIGSSVCRCAQADTHTALAAGDCNDGDANINPKAVETCNGVNDDCNGATDEGCDDDGDKFCDVVMAVKKGAACTNSAVPTDNSAVAGDDCDDTAATTNPASTEICNDKDDNCNSLGDEGCDQDNDGYCNPDMTKAAGLLAICVNSGAAAWAAGANPSTSDCNDKSVAVHPGPVEAENCGTLIDDNCDGSLDGLEAVGCTKFYKDVDNDTFGNSGLFECRCAANGLFKASVGGDCDDGNVDINSSVAIEACDNLDNNCNGLIDDGCDKDGDQYCDAGMTVTNVTICPKSVLNGPHKGDDCNDNSKSINPGATELCDDYDNNCAGGTDEGCDSDNDAYCDAAKVTIGAPQTCTKGGGDCNDDPTAGGFPIHPGATELCTPAGIDENCNSQTDEAGAQGCNTFYFDGDQDKVGISTASTCVCASTGPGFYTATITGDCDDVCSNCYPAHGETLAATEICDGHNNDCNNFVDEGCDGDHDGYCTTAMLTIGKPPICLNGGGDCNDGALSIHPGAFESCNNIDDNCNGVFDENATALDCQTKPGQSTWVCSSAQAKCIAP